MITPCKHCGAVISVPLITPVATLKTLSCPNGHTNVVVGMPSLLEPARVKPARAFPWPPPFQ